MEQSLKKTCLHSRHVALGATMVPFGGFDMPIEYEGIEPEHRAVRTACGVFDVSHMGEVAVSGPDAQKFVNRIFTNDVSVIEDGRILYGMMLREDGGTVDDLLVYRIAHNDYLLVINASNIDKDVAWITAQTAGFNVSVEDRSEQWAEVAVQGPEAERVLRDVLAIDASDLAFYTFKYVIDRDDADSQLLVSRTGYTGEDGFEIYGSHEAIDRIWQRLMAAGVTPCGLGCRDTLRFEAGLPLYGNELDEQTSPVEAGLSMFVKFDKPDFIGREAVTAQKAEGVRYKVVGLEIYGRAIARHGYEVLDMDGNQVGTITTGYHSITLDRNIAMAKVVASSAALGTQLQVRVRRKLFPARVIKKRFYIPNYKK